MCIVEKSCMKYKTTGLIGCLVFVAHGVVGVVRGAQVEPPLNNARRCTTGLVLEHHVAWLKHEDAILHRGGGAEIAGEESDPPAGHRVLEHDVASGAALEAGPRPRAGHVHVDDLVLRGGARDTIACSVGHGARAAVLVGDGEVVGARLEATLAAGARREAAGAAVDRAPRVGEGGAVADNVGVEVAARRLAEGDRVDRRLGHRDGGGGVEAALAVGDGGRVGAGTDEPRGVAGTANAAGAARGVSIGPEGRVARRSSLGAAEEHLGGGSVASRAGAAEGVGRHRDLSVYRVANEGELVHGSALVGSVVAQLHSEVVGSGVVVDVGHIEGAGGAVEGVG
mmetsp:Transcript_78767/g.109415  ORF Transcript_78767/g.109415 Transcript_78767/m.109415 type:complete len:339 (-) Transcript_78767:868-1884(-)